MGVGLGRGETKGPAGIPCPITRVQSQILQGLQSRAVYPSHRKGWRAKRRQRDEARLQRIPSEPEPPAPGAAEQRGGREPCGQLPPCRGGAAPGRLLPAAGRGALGGTLAAARAQLLRRRSAGRPAPPHANELRPDAPIGGAGGARLRQSKPSRAGAMQMRPGGRGAEGTRGQRLRGWRRRAGARALPLGGVCTAPARPGTARCPRALPGPPRSGCAGRGRLPAAAAWRHGAARRSAPCPVALLGHPRP